jgi:hypothetical protein
MRSVTSSRTSARDSVPGDPGRRCTPHTRPATAQLPRFGPHRRGGEPASMLASATLPPLLMTCSSWWFVIETSCRCPGTSNASGDSCSTTLSMSSAPSSAGCSRNWPSRPGSGHSEHMKSRMDGCGRARSDAGGSDGGCCGAPSRAAAGGLLPLACGGGRGLEALNGAPAAADASWCACARCARGIVALGLLPLLLLLLVQCERDLPLVLRLAMCTPHPQSQGEEAMRAARGPDHTVCNAFALCSLCVSLILFSHPHHQQPK